MLKVELGQSVVLAPWIATISSFGQRFDVAAHDPKPFGQTDGHQVEVGH